MRLTLRAFCATSSLVVALFSAKFASADTIHNPLFEMQNNAYTVLPQTGGGSMVTYSVPAGSASHNSFNGSLQAEDSFLPLSDEDYDDAVLFKNAAAPPTPETRNFVLLGSGLLTAAGFLRRRKIAVRIDE